MIIEFILYFRYPSLYEEKTGPCLVFQITKIRVNSYFCYVVHLSERGSNYAEGGFNGWGLSIISVILSLKVSI